MIGLRSTRRNLARAVLIQGVVLACLLAGTTPRPVLAAPVLEREPHEGMTLLRTPQAGTTILRTPQAGTTVLRTPQASVRLQGFPSQAEPPADPVSAPPERARPPRLQSLGNAQRVRPKIRPERQLPAPIEPQRQLGYGINLNAKATQTPAGETSTDTEPASAVPQWLLELQSLLDAEGRDAPPQRLLDLVAEHGAALRERVNGAQAEQLGWALYRAGQYRDAAPWFRLALERDTTRTGATAGLAYALHRAGDLAEAYRVAGGLEALRTFRGDMAVQLALQARDRKDWAEALHWLERAMAAGRDGRDVQALRAWTELDADQARAAAARFAALYAAEPNDDLAKGLYLSLERSGQTLRIAELAAQPGLFATLARHQAARRWRELGLAADAALLDPKPDSALRGAAGPSIALGTALRDKSGSPGTSQLRLAAMPQLNARWSNACNLWQLDVAAPRLDAGATPPIGAVGSTLPGIHGSVRQQHTDVSFTLHWRRCGPVGAFAAIGLTPEGEVSSAWTGTLGWREVGTDSEWHASVYRTLVDDSTLSVSGLRDPASGLAWGRVLRLGAQAQGHRGIGADWSVSGSVRAETLTGQHVASNKHVAASVGLARNLSVPHMRFFSLGPSVGFEHYQRNLSGFTWGHGGYFSPQQFISASLMAVFQTQEQRRLILAGQLQVGWQSVRQEDSPCFALTPPVNPAPNCPNPGASTSSGLGTSFSLQGSHLIAPNWALEGRLRLRTGPAYLDQAAYFGLRYFFQPRSALFGSDLPSRSPF